MPQDFYTKLVSLLKKNTNFLDKQGELLKHNAIDAAYKGDKKLIELLFEDKNTHKKFFNEIKGVLVFNANDFVVYIQDKNFLADSYTKYRNKIGLNIDGKFLNERKEVALVWPFKDCVLEGGMAKDDEKRKEIFFNEILAQDEIDQLFTPKVLTNWKRYAAADVIPAKLVPDPDRGAEIQLKRDENGVIRENLIIKGNNLLALHSLKIQFQNKVKLIYIDPPYNTGNDSFGYNDNFNHSTWLTFMKNRLEAARELLREDGVIFISCDDNEQAYLKVLCDEVFGELCFVATISAITNPAGRDYGGIAKTNDCVLLYKKEEKTELNWIELEKEFPYKDGKGGFELRELRNRNIRFNIENRPNLFYPFYLNPRNINKNGFYEIGVKKQKGWIEVWPQKSQGIQTVWRWGKEKAEKNINFEIVGKKSNGGADYRIMEKYRETKRMARSIWNEKEIRNEVGTLHIKELFDGKIFDYPKSEFLLKKIIEIGSNERDIVLDFFAGSGTSGATAMKMKRQFILIEQMDYVEKVTVERLKKVIKGEQGGISKAVNWKGGGDFIYCELMKYNENFVEKIQKVKNMEELLKIWEEMKEKSFLNYSVDIKKLDKTINEFKKLPLNQQKQTLFDLLNKNQLYINLSEIEDGEFGVGEVDKLLNREFYG